MSFKNKWKSNITKDETLPEYYSELTIFCFTIIFGVLFGSILLAINLRKIAPKYAVIAAIVFGILQSVLIALLSSQYSLGWNSALVSKFLGLYILHRFFWKKYINKTEYRAKPIWIPLIIGIIILGLIYWFYWLPLTNTEMTPVIPDFSQFSH